MKQNIGVELEDPNKPQYTKYVRGAVGNMLQDLSEKQLKQKSNSWRYDLIDVPEDRCIGILIRPAKIQKLRRKLDIFGLMVIKEQRLVVVNNHVSPTDSTYLFSLRIPEEQDIEKYLE
jgi:hypothetical protein